MLTLHLCGITRRIQKQENGHSTKTRRPYKSQKSCHSTKNCWCKFILFRNALRNGTVLVVVVVVVICTYSFRDLWYCLPVANSIYELTLLFCSSLVRFFAQETEFNDVGNSIMSRLDEMGKRMDDLDSSISDLMNQAGLDGSDPSSPSSSPKGGSPTNATKNSNSAVL